MSEKRLQQTVEEQSLEKDASKQRFSNLTAAVGPADTAAEVEVPQVYGNYLATTLGLLATAGSMLYTKGEVGILPHNTNSPFIQKSQI